MSCSPPPTPPSKAPKGRDSRFKPIISPCEWVEDYRPGGFHPVHLGDTFRNGQYKVIRKLGEGSFSTVWLAHDLQNDRYVALKVLSSQTSSSSTELELLRHVTKLAPERSARHITQLLDEFEHHGPNGVHQCLVFEPMGPSVNSMVEKLPQFKNRTFNTDVRYPSQMAKSILKQSLQALAFLHEHGIAHGDFQPGNMLFGLDDINSTPEPELRQTEDVEAHSISPPVERLDGKEDKWAPRYLCIAQPLDKFSSHAEGFQIKLSDMGGAYFFTNPPAKPLTPLGLRAPELILSDTVNETLDVWSFGCLVFELVTGQPLCCVIKGFGHEDDEHLLLLTQRLGALPDDLYKQWETSSLYFTPERKLFNCQVGGVEEGEEPYMSKLKTMEEVLDETTPDLGEKETQQIKALVRRILQYDPAKRPSPAEILMDPWFCDVEEEDCKTESLPWASYSEWIPTCRFL